MMEWVQIDEHTWRYEEGDVRFFLLEGTESALLIDSGMHVHNARELAGQLTNLPVVLINTHADLDHVGSNDEFEKIMVSAAELVHPQMRGRSSSQVIEVWDGDVIDLGSRTLEVIALPGHTPGSIALLDEGSGMLFSGDPIQRDGRIFMFGPMRSLAAYILSLRRLQARAWQIASIWPCHATCPVGPETISELIEAAERIERGEVPFSEETMFGQTVRAYDAGVSVFLCNADGTL